MRRSRLLLAVFVAAIVLVPLVWGNAASLNLSSQSLTTHTAASTVTAATCTVSPAGDATIAEGAPSTNYGGDAQLLVRSENTLDRRSLVRFDLSSCSIPSGASIRSAAMKLTVTTPPAQSRTYLVHRGTAAWGETTVTWDTQPTVETGATASTATGTTAGVVQWDVKGDVAAFVAGTATNHGWQVRDQTEDAATAVQTEFAAREHTTAANRPSLVITYYP